MNRVAAALALSLCAAMPAFAQNREGLPVIGILRMNTADNVEPFATGFKDALAALGRVDGRNIRIEVRLAEGHVERLPELAQSLVQAKANVILGEHIGAALRRREVRQDDARHLVEAEQMGGEHPAVAGNNAVLFVDQHRVGEAKFADRGGDLRDLLVAVRARVSGNGDQRRAPAPNNRLG